MLVLARFFSSGGRAKGRKSLRGFCTRKEKKRRQKSGNGNWLLLIHGCLIVAQIKANFSYRESEPHLNGTWKSWICVPITVQKAILSILPTLPPLNLLNFCYMKICSFCPEKQLYTGAKKATNRSKTRSSHKGECRFFPTIS